MRKFDEFSSKARLHIQEKSDENGIDNVCGFSILKNTWLECIFGFGVVALYCPEFVK